MAEKDEPKIPSRTPDTIQREISESEKTIERPRPSDDSKKK